MEKKGKSFKMEPGELGDGLGWIGLGVNNEDV